MDRGDAESADAESAFTAWVNRKSDGQVTSTGAILKKGRDVMKTVQTRYFGHAPDGEPSRRELRFRTHTVRGRTEFDFDDNSADKTSWYCQNDEIDRLVGYLTESVDRTGRFRMVEADSSAAQLAALLTSNRIDPGVLLAALVENTTIEQLTSLLADHPDGLTAARSTVLEERRTLVARLRELIDKPATTEPAIQRLIGDAYWIFGGRYVGVAERRRLMVLDETDIPLLCADGSLHIVELKVPGVRDLVVRHRNHWIAGKAVHEAVSQAQNYLRALDEQGPTLAHIFRTELGQHYDFSRIFATVVIGHSDHYRHADLEPDGVVRTLRQYTAGLNRVDVITYDQLADNATRALKFEHITGERQ